MNPLTTSTVLALANVALFLRHPRPVVRLVRRHRRLPNVAAPTEYPERMLWRKLVDRNPMFVCASDKLACKAYIRDVCPDVAVPETLWVGSDVDDIPERLLERDAWLKASHGCTFNHHLPSDGTDRSALKRTTERWLRTVWGTETAEWAYSEVRPRLFVEESVGDPKGDLLEFNIRASTGRFVRGSVIGHNKMPDQWVVYLDRDGNATPGPAGDLAELPPGVEIEPYLDAIEHTRRLSREFDYARFDFFWNGRTLYAGEITIYPGAGVADIRDPEFRRDVLQLWDLRDAHFVRSRRDGLAGIYAAALDRRLTTRREQSGAGTGTG